MQQPDVEPEQSAEYARLIERRAEFERLTLQAQRRKPLLIFGPEGVGKTRLLQEFAQTQPLALYVSQIRSPHDMLLSLANSLHTILGARSLPPNTSTMGTASLKGGVVNAALDVKAFLLIVDHVEGPSRIVTKIIKELGYYGRTPIFLGARSPHMEDIGTLQPLCADRSERLELLNWPQHVALEFARHEAERTGLWASKLCDVTWRATRREMLL